LMAMVISPATIADGYWLKGFYDAWLGKLDEALSELQKAMELAEQIATMGKKSFVEQTRAWIYYDQGEFELSRKNISSTSGRMPTRTAPSPPRPGSVWRP